MILRSHSTERTREIGAQVGARARAGDVVVLQGDLGAGKTTFTQGLGSALGVLEPVTSPTFVVAREHSGTGLGLVHVDAYRLASIVEWDDLDIDLDQGVNVIEWGDRIVEALPADHLVIRFLAEEAKDAEDADDCERILEFTATGPRSADLLAALEAAA
ncbi:MAG TPA: tRNA (adenosine(37)-N6)-threonylcarbamoyltransferase complex ATPase subunit type 1 TsaE [Candidatus Nanopelagicales bacterium]|nr:tRNA (adenosine(37)-N6)-threonylcarbamoyltransferase complex ATPase subunit type 1 TsaE [Candidatus Nanopelagicales bacterium]